MHISFNVEDNSYSEVLISSPIFNPIKSLDNMSRGLLDIKPLKYKYKIKPKSKVKENTKAILAQSSHDRLPP